MVTLERRFEKKKFEKNGHTGGHIVVYIVTTLKVFSISVYRKYRIVQTNLISGYNDYTSVNE